MQTDNIIDRAMLIAFKHVLDKWSWNRYQKKMRNQHRRVVPRMIYNDLRKINENAFLTMLFA